MTAKKIIKRALCSLVIIILVFVSGLATIILNPQFLFANKVEYKQFNVYSNEKIDNKIKPILDTVLSLVNKSELYDPAYKVDIFLSYGTFFNKIDDKVFGYGPTARAISNNLVFKVAVDINNNLVYPTFHKPCEEHFDYVIAHEMTHCLQAHKYGILKFNPFEHPDMWKLEGYPEYVARHKFSSSADDLKKDIERFMELKRKQTDIWILETEGGCEVPDFYYKGMLMIEYLMNARHFTYDQILKDTREEEEIYSEMTEWATKR
jgi:hypothetical protein